MLPAKNLPLSYNPIDIVENIFAAKSFEFERRNINEVVIEVQGKWNNMLLFFCLGINHAMPAPVLPDGH